MDQTRRRRWSTGKEKLREERAVESGCTPIDSVKQLSGTGATAYRAQYDRRKVAEYLRRGDYLALVSQKPQEDP